MNLFLTSSIGAHEKKDGIRIPCALDGSNGFTKLMKDIWPAKARCLIISADPMDPAVNDSLLSILPRSFALSGLPVADTSVCDARNAQLLSSALPEYNVLFLAGGHVPTQNRFFHEIGLKFLLEGYEGPSMPSRMGSFLHSDGQRTTLYGEGYLLKDGEITQICHNGEGFHCPTA